MMVISGESITIINQDTAHLDVSMENYIFQSGDKVYFTVKKSATDSVALIEKTITSFNGATAQIELTSDDTNLEAGTYTYDVQLSLSDGTVDTVIGPASFTVVQGVTHKL